MKGIQDGVAVVTGGGSGIGRQSSLRFAEAGAKVVVADVDEDGGYETVELIEEAGGEAIFVNADVTDSDDVDSMVQTAIDEYGGLDFAHNNAGIADEGARLAEYDEEEWDRMIDINLKGVWRCLKAEIPEMIERGGGAIVNTSSVAGVSANGSAHYVASKHGVIGLTRRATIDYAGEGIRFNAVCPGVIDTPMVQQAGEDNSEEMDRITAGIPADRLGDPQEIADAVVWLCSEEASYVMGQPIIVDGGLLAQ
ncbi:short-chain dehydrogenase/reductase SDR [Halorubrum coriense DSM 10284]|uniref:Short-chain dehydrogenase/reductase SDR n=1 Tax=Halorubrum coriense DSM 10284 TaxID=1227466 RepID=M0EUE1_9EURY|nr:glucose 1-dehydrogenase [Halorubrum coriense]ELZ50492.1 short-chain dehydrogenase/reductase SDR [Halorubrum coriense DSM 10284]